MMLRDFQTLSNYYNQSECANTIKLTNQISKPVNKAGTK